MSITLSANLQPLWSPFPLISCLSFEYWGRWTSLAFVLWHVIPAFGWKPNPSILSWAGRCCKCGAWALATTFSDRLNQENHSILKQVSHRITSKHGWSPSFSSPAVDLWKVTNAQDVSTDMVVFILRSKDHNVYRMSKSCCAWNKMACISWSNMQKKKKKERTISKHPTVSLNSTSISTTMSSRLFLSRIEYLYLYSTLLRKEHNIKTKHRQVIKYYNINKKTNTVYIVT